MMGNELEKRGQPFFLVGGTKAWKGSLSLCPKAKCTSCPYVWPCGAGADWKNPNKKSKKPRPREATDRFHRSRQSWAASCSLCVLERVAAYAKLCLTGNWRATNPWNPLSYSWHFGSSRRAMLITHSQKDRKFKLAIQHSQNHFQNAFAPYHM